MEEHQIAILFSLGQTVITRTALATLPNEDVQVALERHSNGDWGNVCPEDHKANQEALNNGLRLLSVYADSLGTTFWIITEWDRSITTVLLPEDY